MCFILDARAGRGRSLLLRLVSPSRKKRDEKFTVSSNFPGVAGASLNACRSERHEGKNRRSRLTPFPCVAVQRVTPQSPPPPPKPPSPSFELGLSSFPPLPGAAGHLKTDDVFESRLASSVVIGAAKERVNYLRLFSLPCKQVGWRRNAVSCHLGQYWTSLLTVLCFSLQRALRDPQPSVLAWSP